MTCCNPLVSYFFNESITTVPYTGVKPIVQVLYKQPDNTYLAAGIFTQIEITATDIIIDHGGSETGIVKILQ